MTPEKLFDSYTKAETDGKEWKKDYPEFERLANNELLPDLDENLPETNDGSLAAALFKLPKRVVPSNITGSPRALDRDDLWINEFAKIEWEKNIVPNANTQAPFQAKWKDAVRKAGIYGSVPLVTLTTKKNGKTLTDFVVAYPHDCWLEPGKVSDYDSDVVYWDVYYSERQIDDIIKSEQDEIKEAKAENRPAYTTWKLKELKDVLKFKHKQERDQDNVPKGLDDKTVTKSGIKITFCFNRGVNSKFYALAHGTKEIVREWDNPDPTGDIPIHYLYCYQDFINPYGIGIVKLAGGTQNVLDYMRQADVLATQIGIRPPILISGDTSETDLDSFVYGQDVLWFAGRATVARQELGNNVYNQLPTRVGMYKTSLNNLIPTGDTTISGESGDPQYSKTPAGVKFQQANLSVDDQDMKDKLFLAYSAVGKSMINTHFANKQGSDIMQLSETERERIFKSAPELFPQFSEQVDPETGEVLPPSKELEVIWENTRATFDFEVDPEPETSQDESEKLDGALRVLELVNADPTLPQELQMSGKKLNKGELLADIIGLLTENDKIITDISPEEQAEMEAEQQAQMERVPQEMPQQMEQPAQEPMDPQMEAPIEQPLDQELPTIEQLIEAYADDERMIGFITDAAQQGFNVMEIIEAIRRNNAI